MVPAWLWIVSAGEGQALIPQISPRPGLGLESVNEPPGLEALYLQPALEDEF